MDDYEQQFAQNLQVAQQPEPPKTSKTPLIITIVLAAIVIIESIVLVVALAGQPSTTTEGEDSTDEEEVVDPNEYIDQNHIYDDQDRLTAVNLTCTADTGAYYKLTSDRKYEAYDSSKQLVSSGTYTIISDMIIPLTSSNGGDKDHTIYYDGYIIADGNTPYECPEVEEE